MRIQTICFVVLYFLSYVGTVLIGLCYNPAPFANVMGVLSLFCYIATLLPSLLKAVLPGLRSHPVLSWLLKYRRHLGIAAFGFGVNHGVLLGIQHELNFLEQSTYFHYFQGISTLTIFTILAVTSNDESVKKLKKNWKKLHQLTYLAIFILPWHILDKMAGHWTTLTPIAVLVTCTISLVFLYRQWLEWNRTQLRSPQT